MGAERQGGLNHDGGRQFGRSVTKDRAPAALIFEILADPQRHRDFDGSDMLRGAVFNGPISDVGDTFTMKMHRLGRDYLMINTWWSSSRIAASSGNPLPETPVRLAVIHPEWASLRATAGATGLTPDGDDTTVVTEVFDCGPEESRRALLREGGAWINGPIR